MLFLSAFENASPPRTEFRDPGSFSSRPTFAPGDITSSKSGLSHKQFIKILMLMPFHLSSSSLRVLLLALAMSCLSLIGIIILAFKTTLPSPSIANSPSPSTTPVSLSHASKCALVLVLLGLVAFLGWKVMEKAQRQNGKNIKARV